MKKGFFIILIYFLLLITLIDIIYITYCVWRVDDFGLWFMTSGLYAWVFVVVVFYVCMAINICMAIKYLKESMGRRKPNHVGILTHTKLIICICMIMTMLSYVASLEIVTAKHRDIKNKLSRLMIHSNPSVSLGENCWTITAKSKKFDKIIFYGLGPYGVGIIGVRCNVVVSNFIILPRPMRGYIVNNKLYGGIYDKSLTFLSDTGVSDGEITNSDIDGIDELIKELRANSKLWGWRDANEIYWLNYIYEKNDNLRKKMLKSRP